MTKKIAILMCLCLASCTGTQLTEDGAKTTNLGHGVMRMGGTSVSGDGLQTPTGLWMDDKQHSKVSSFPETGMVVVLPDKSRLSLSSSKDGEVASVNVIKSDGTSVTVEGVSYKASSVLLSQAEQLMPLVDYAKSLSADEREKFIRAFEAAAPEVATLLRLLIGV